MSIRNLIILSLFIFPIKAFALSCDNSVRPPSPQADAIFIATPLKEIGATECGPEALLAKVEHSFKGKASGEVLLHISGGCEFGTRGKYNLNKHYRFVAFPVAKNQFLLKAQGCGEKNVEVDDIAVAIEVDNKNSSYAAIDRAITNNPMDKEALLEAKLQLARYNQDYGRLVDYYTAKLEDHPLYFTLPDGKILRTGEDVSDYLRAQLTGPDHERFYSSPLHNDLAIWSKKRFETKEIRERLADAYYGLRDAQGILDALMPIQDGYLSPRSQEAFAFAQFILFREKPIIVTLDLHNDSIYDVNFSDFTVHSNLQNARLIEANYENARVSGDMKNVKFIKSNFKNAIVKVKFIDSASIPGNLILNSNLVGADFSNATFDENFNLHGSQYDCRTKWPEGFDPQKAGAKIEGSCTTAPPSSPPRAR